MKKVLLFLMVFCLICPVVQAEEKMYSLTTGRETTQAYRPMVVQMDNEPGARPQCGIGSADVVYETEVYNGGYTRYTCVFNDEIPERVEAVRSARILHIDIYREWGGAFVNYGFQNAQGSDAQSYAQEVVTDLFNGHVGIKGFYRDDSRKAPNNVVCKLQSLYEQMSQEVPERSPLSFSDTPTQQGGRVDVFRIPYSQNLGYYPSYEWDEEAGQYRRYYNGNAHKDGYTGQQLTCSNVIVQYVEYSWYGGDGNRPVVEMTGTNRCDYFIGGYHFTGYWVRDDLTQNTVYYDDQGQVVQFARGKTFIQILKDEKSVEMVE